MALLKNATIDAHGVVSVQLAFFNSQYVNAHIHMSRYMEDLISESNSIRLKNNRTKFTKGYSTLSPAVKYNLLAEKFPKNTELLNIIRRTLFPYE